LRKEFSKLITNYQIILVFALNIGQNAIFIAIKNELGLIN